ncbi:MAG: cytochrome c maturation protein CcmE [Chloroflexota bacterium]
MRRRRWLFGPAVIVVVLLGLGVRGWYDMTRVYYLTVSELQAKGEAAYSEGSRVGGTVVAGSVEWDKRQGLLRFHLSDDGATGQALRVVYRGTAPDGFKAGVVAIAEGRLGRDGVFQATQVLLKCPHSYLPQ